MADQSNENITALTVQLLSAFLANGSVSAEELPALIASTKSALAFDPLASDPLASGTTSAPPKRTENTAHYENIMETADRMFAESPSFEIIGGTKGFGADLGARVSRPTVTFQPREPRIPDADPIETQAPQPKLYRPAVSLEKSLASQHVILSMLNGKPYKSLKSHLTRAGLTPDDYRERFDLPADYPMTAPSYSAQRSDQAKRLGYGRKPSATHHRARTGAASPATATNSQAQPPQAKRPRGRPRKDATA